ncbi:hypothetical protein GCM10020001_098660 [Nonomuraea salmonea]
MDAVVFVDRGWEAHVSEQEFDQCGFDGESGLVGGAGDGGAEFGDVHGAEGDLGFTQGGQEGGVAEAVAVEVGAQSEDHQRAGTGQGVDR